VLSVTIVINHYAASVVVVVVVAVVVCFYKLYLLSVVNKQCLSVFCLSVLLLVVSVGLV
jgi:hypothetical protein